jgi:hypothetical protein
MPGLGPINSKFIATPREILSPRLAGTAVRAVPASRVVRGRDQCSCSYLNESWSLVRYVIDPSSSR